MSIYEKALYLLTNFGDDDKFFEINLNDNYIEIYPITFEEFLAKLDKLSRKKRFKELTFSRFKLFIYGATKIEKILVLKK